jgi:hypothetical protein
MLTSIALYLTGKEWIGHEGPVVWLRRWRRTLAGAILVVISWHIWTGQLPSDPNNTALALDLLHHWLRIFVFVLVLIAMAMWDAWDGIRNLRGYLETVEKDEVTKIQEHLREKKELEAKPTFIEEPDRNL